MAVQSRPSLRSSSRRNTKLEEVPPNQTQPKTHRGKRPRAHSPGCDSNISIKKQKPSPPTKTELLNNNSKTRALKSLPLRDKLATKVVVTSCTPDPDPPPDHANGLPNTGLNTVIANHPLATNQNNALTVNTPNALKQTDKRNLRSHDGASRSKSELAPYFPNYDELVSIEPREPDFLTPETLLHITDEPSKLNATTTNTTSSHTAPRRGRPPNKSKLSSNSHFVLQNDSSHIPKLSETMFTDLNEATRVDLSSLDKSTRNQKDPLSDAFYLKAHRRAERQEKQLRNIEKERAMHEKVQLERLMDGLKGHDWLRVMGVSGITDTEKKLYEPKREYFIQEVRVLLKKFQEWKEEEKRRKVEKEESMLDEDEDQEESNEDQVDGEEVESGNSANPSSPITDPSPSDPAARQLHHESILANVSKSTARSHHKKPHNPPTITQPKTFTSFFSKPYLREAAISQHRRGRARYAFGQPLPEVEHRDFELGEDIITEEVLEKIERRRRVRARGQ